MEHIAGETAQLLSYRLLWSGSASYGKITQEVGTGMAYDLETLTRTLVGLRLRLNLSQSLAARKAGLEHTTVCRWERGTRSPKRTSLEVYLQALGASALESRMAMNAAGYAQPDGKEAFPLDRRLAELNLVLLDPEVAPAVRRSLSQHVDFGLEYARRARIEGVA